MLSLNLKNRARFLVVGLLLASCSSIPGSDVLDAGSSAQGGQSGRGGAPSMSGTGGAPEPRRPPPPNACGNGQKNPSEDCDDGNRKDGDGCDADCKREPGFVAPPRCGNGKVEEDETCDDGNRNNRDGCSAFCQEEAGAAVCGNNVLEGREECDDGNLNNTDGCSIFCTKVACGNGRRELNEECDDGNTVDGDNCPANCGVSVCGNGIVDDGEECDDGNGVETDTCSNSCVRVACGNGRKDPGEECDPGAEGENTQCTRRCTNVPPHCGDSTLQPDEGEQCDDGNAVATDGCEYCARTCGDGVLERDKGEQCEPGVTEGRYCLTEVLNSCVRCNRGQQGCAAREPCDVATCRWLPQCGDGIVQADVGEQCDTPNGVDCDDSCNFIAPLCGDGIRQAAEECDDPVDPGCVDCVIVVPGSCGNGQLDPGEQCDSLDHYVCDEHCRFPSCTPLSGDLLANGNFEGGIAPWVAEFPSQLTRVSDGATAPGALEVSFAAAPSIQAQVTGARVCVQVQPETRYDLQARYKMPPDQQGFRATVSLFLHRTADCSDPPAEPLSAPLRGRELGEWTPYAESIETRSVDASDGRPLYLRVRLEALRLPGTAAGWVLWDDVVFERSGAGASGSSTCGNCALDDKETCDDANQIAGDGCSATCQREACETGTEPFCNACNQCSRSHCEAEADACLNLSGAATAGPGKGLRRSLLCGELRSCVQSSGCFGQTAIVSARLLFGADGTVPALENCYCGSAGDDCIFGGANGSCRRQVEGVLETTDPVEIFQRFSGSDDDYPGFARAKELLKCETEAACECVETAVCGNGIVQDRSAAFLSENSVCAEALQTVPGCFIEECDGDDVPFGQSCDDQCFIVSCGNGITQAGEDCDDGNTASIDGCSEACKAEFKCGDGRVDSAFEPCDTLLTAPAPLCLKTELDAGTKSPEQCGCTAVNASASARERCELSVCGNGITQPEAGEECDPPIAGACSADCKLELEPCTQCMLSFDYRDVEGVETCAGAGAFVSASKNETPGFGCLEDAACFGLWHCAKDSGCADEGSGFFSCYCGHGEDINDCQAPTFQPKGACLSQVRAAFEAQTGAPPRANTDVFEQINSVPGVVNGVMMSASTARFAIEGCLVGRERLETDLRIAKAAGALENFSVEQCLSACAPLTP